MKLLIPILAFSLCAPAAYSTESFPGTRLGPQPEAKQLWMTPVLRERMATVLGHPFAGMRIRYWQSGDRTAWVLDEIGKEQPITAGFIVRQGRIESTEILAYRESRGGEVQQPVFTRQFRQAGLDKSGGLDRQIDGITGATLSVSAVTRMARAALVLDAARTAGTP